MGQRLTPSMKDGHEARFAAQMPGSCADGRQRCGHRVEQDTVGHGLVLIFDRSDLGTHGEHDMEIRHGQQVRLARGEPLLSGSALALGALPVAGLDKTCVLEFFQSLANA